MAVNSTLMAPFTCFQPRRQMSKSHMDGREVWSPTSHEPVTVVTSSLTFNVELATSMRDRHMVAICWHAPFFRLDAQIVSAFEELAAAYSNGRTKFLLCSLDHLSDVAREFAVHDLPSFHIFDSGVLVERLSGLQSLQDIPMLLAAYQRLHKQEADTPTSVLSVGDEAYPTASLSINIPRSPPATASASSCDGSNESCASVPVNSPSDWASDHRYSSGASTVSSPSSYLPRYVRSRAKGQQRTANSSRAGSWCKSQSLQIRSLLSSPADLQHCRSLSNARRSGPGAAAA